MSRISRLLVAAACVRRAGTQPKAAIGLLVGSIINYLVDPLVVTACDRSDP